MSDGKAVKHDAGKPPLALIPPHAELLEAEAFADGRGKYGLHNYLEGGLTAVQLVSSVKRHINAWLRGEELAPDSKVHHLGHARAGLGMLIELQAQGTLVDDRYRRPAPLKSVYSVVAIAKLSKSRISLGAYPTRVEAEGHLARHRRDWPIDSFEVNIEEVPGD